MQVLPNGAADGARDPDVVLQSRQVSFDSLGYELRHDRTALHPELAIVGKAQVVRGIPNDQAAESLVAYENVGTQSEDGVVDTSLAGGGYGPCQIVRRCRLEEESGGSTKRDCGVFSKALDETERAG